MAAILCLAHYCDTHGPTPLMTCEGLPVACRICFEDDGSRTNRRSSVSHSIRSDGSNRPSKTFSQNSFRSTEEEAPMLTASTIDATPESPRVAPAQNGRAIPRRDSSFRKTYDDNDQKRAIPCENCALTIPSKMKEQIPDGAPGSPVKNGLPSSSSPILRTRVPYERVATLDAPSPQSTSSSSSDAGEAPNDHPTTFTRTTTSSTVSSIKTSSTSSSSSTSSATSHKHFMLYTSTHDPQSSTSFSALRASCLRTLSCETLPPSITAPTSNPIPQSPGFPSPSMYSRSLNNTTLGGGGPIFFGDSQAGYTTAFIFRVPDPCARGRRRIYSFISWCPSEAGERKAMAVFNWLSERFRELAGWIQSLAEGEADRVDMHVTGAPRRGSSGLDSMVGSLGGSSGMSRGNGGLGSGGGAGGFGGIGSGTFSRRSVNGGGGWSGAPKNRGLAELVGRQDFFIDLHARFVALSAQLARMGFD